jgi:hypothetical protein
MLHDLDNPLDVLVRKRRLLGEALVGRAADDDPCDSNCRRSSPPPILFRAAVRERARPAPWHVVPNDRSSEPGSPASTKLDVPMLPGMSTGSPTEAYAAGPARHQGDH